MSVSRIYTKIAKIWIFLSSYCACGNSYGSQGVSTNCNMPCSGNSLEICGGGGANSVYQVSLCMLLFYIKYYIKLKV